MKPQHLHRLVIAFFVLYLVAVTWPLAMWVSDPLPLIFGLPLPLAWSILWIVLGFVVLLVLDWFTERS